MVDSVGGLEPTSKSHMGDVPKSAHVDCFHRHLIIKLVI